MLHPSISGKIRGYSKFAHKLIRIGKCFNVSFQKNEQKYVRLMFQLMAAIDIYIDNDTAFSESKEFRFSVIETCAKTGDWSSAPRPISMRMALIAQQEMLIDYNAINSITSEILLTEMLMRKAETIPAFIKARGHQGALAADVVFVNLLSNSRDPNIVLFSNFIREFTITGNLIDTFLDMELDYSERNISLKPSLHFRLILFREICMRMKDCLWLFLNKPKIFIYLSGDLFTVIKSWFWRTTGLTP